MAAVYGYETQPKNDRIFHVVDRMLSFSTNAMTPEREALASTFPIRAFDGYSLIFIVLMFPSPWNLIHVAVNSQVYPDVDAWVAVQA